DHARKLAIQILGSPKESPAMQSTPEPNATRHALGAAESTSSEAPSAPIPDNTETDQPQTGNKSRPGEKRKRTTAGGDEPDPAASDAPPPQPVHLSRKEAIRHLEAWLTKTKQAFVVADAKKRAGFTESKLGTLDFIVYERLVNRLVTVRKKLTAAELHDMREWQRIFGSE